MQNAPFGNCRGEAAGFPTGRRSRAAKDAGAYTCSPPACPGKLCSRGIRVIFGVHTVIRQRGLLRRISRSGSLAFVCVAYELAGTQPFPQNVPASGTPAHTQPTLANFAA